MSDDNPCPCGHTCQNPTGKLFEFRFEYETCEEFFLDVWDSKRHQWQQLRGAELPSVMMAAIGCDSVLIGMVEIAEAALVEAHEAHGKTLEMAAGEMEKHMPPGVPDWVKRERP